MDLPARQFDQQDLSRQGDRGSLQGQTLVGSFSLLSGGNTAITFGSAAAKSDQTVSLLDIDDFHRVLGGADPRQDQIQVAIRSLNERIANLLAPSVDHENKSAARLTGPVQVIRKIASDWALTEDEFAQLLNYGHSDRARELLDGRISLRGQDREDRVRLIYRIYSALSELFADSARQNDWLRAANPMLGNKSPLETMKSDRIPGMVTVRNLVDRLAGR